MDGSQGEKEYLHSCPGCGSQIIFQQSIRNEFFSCQKCGLIFTNPRPTQEFVAKNYCAGGYYKRFQPDEKWNGMWRRRVQRVTRRISGGTLLDVGAGIGTALSMFKNLNFRVVGTEISTEAIEKAKQLYGIELLQGPVENLGFTENSFDAITLWHVFEHLPFPGKTLAYLSHLLKSGGYLFIAVPNNSFWQKIHDPRFLFSGKQKKLEAIIPRVNYEKTFSEIHLIHFLPRSLKRILMENGFDIKELNMDNISLRPGWIKDFKYALRNFFAGKFKIYTHEALFVCGRKK